MESRTDVDEGGRKLVVKSRTEEGGVAEGGEEEVVDLRREAGW